MKIQNKIMALIIAICLFSTLSLSVTLFITEKRLSKYSTEVNTTLADNAAAGGSEALISAAYHFLQIIAREQSYNCNNMLNNIKFNVKLVEGVVQDIFNNQRLYTGSRPVITPSETVRGIYANTYSLPVSVPMTDEIRHELDLLSNMNLLIPMLAENPNVIDIYVGTKRGLFYNYTNLMLENPEYDPRLRPWYIRALENPDEVIFTEDYEDAFGLGMVVTAAKAVFDNKGELIGVAALDILLEDLKDLVSEARVTDSGYVFIINREGRYIVHPDMGQDDFNPFLTNVETGTLAEGYRRMMNGEQGFCEGSIDGARVFMTFSPISVASWSIGVIIYEEEILSPLQSLVEQLNDYAMESEEKIVSIFTRSMFVTGAIIIVIVVMVMMLSVFLTRIISTPIRKLIGEVVRIGKGDFTYRIPVESHDEIGFLTEAFNKMADNLYNHAQNIAALNQEKTLLESTVNTDALTGIYNRRYMEETMNRIIKTMQRSGGGKLSVLMMDIDFFKKYNDTYGHAEGDNCLRAVAETIESSVTRDDDFVARYGGEEFTAVLPNTDENGVRVIAERVLENVRKRNIPHEKSETASCVTISMGAVTGDVKIMQSGIEYIKLADEALYVSKKNGRNRVTFCEVNIDESPGGK